MQIPCLVGTAILMFSMVAICLARVCSLLNLGRHVFLYHIISLY